MILTAETIKDAILTLWGPGQLNDAAAAIGCDVSTLRRWLKEGQEPQARYAGRAKRAIQDRANTMTETARRFT